MKEKTLVLIKPDSFKAKIETNILDDLLSIEDVKLEKCKKIKATKKQIIKHYNNDRQRIINHGGDIDAIVNYMTSDYIMILVLSGTDIVNRMRIKRGIATKPINCNENSIRYHYVKYCNEKHNDRCIKNFIHSSRSLYDAEYEINIWFGGSKFFYTKMKNFWLSVIAGVTTTIICAIATHIYRLPIYNFIINNNLILLLLSIATILGLSIVIIWLVFKPREIKLYKDQSKASKKLKKSVRDSEEITILGVGCERMIGDESPVYEELEHEKDKNIKIFFLKIDESQNSKLKQYIETRNKPETIEDHIAKRKSILTKIKNKKGSYFSQNISCYEYDNEIPRYRIYLTDKALFLSFFAHSQHNARKGHELPMYKINKSKNNSGLFEVFKDYCLSLENNSTKLF